MAVSGDKQQDILLIITALLFLIFSTGSAREPEIPAETIIIPPG